MSTKKNDEMRAKLLLKPKTEDAIAALQKDPDNGDLWYAYAMSHRNGEGARAQGRVDPRAQYSDRSGRPAAVFLRACGGEGACEEEGFLSGLCKARRQGRGAQ